ncbi:EAL domain-containing protein [Bordetella sp. FB-8]|uniref:EAL domain-containing protein n=1 Tax=Bordetella sp. FB-8 TaxID=1159870 RepID=UPI000477DDBD|nr:EAL domain-containing protein [Bordetella sp. FB-8]
MTRIPLRNHAQHIQSDESCAICGDGAQLDFDFSYAFQPIIDIRTRQVFAHEALIRGPGAEPAPSVLERVTPTNRYQFDQACRVRAIKTAAGLGMQSRLSINFLPNAIYRPEVCISTTLRAAQAYGFPIGKIIFETVEGERIDDGKWLAEVFREYQRIGFSTAIDDFGAGYAGLNLLADFQPDIIKLDMGLIRDVDKRKTNRVIAAAVVGICAELGIKVVAEGVETRDELLCLRDIGVELIQGYLLSKPLFEGCMPDADIVLPL